MRQNTNPRATFKEDASLKSRGNPQQSAQETHATNSRQFGPETGLSVLLRLVEEQGSWLAKDILS